MKKLEFRETKNEVGTVTYKAQGIFADYKINIYKDDVLLFVLSICIGQFKTLEKAENVANELHKKDADNLLNIAKKWELI